MASCPTLRWRVQAPVLTLPGLPRTNGAGEAATLAAHASFIPGQSYVATGDAGPAGDLRLTSGTTLSSNLVVNSLLLLGNVGVTLNSGTSNFTLGIASGGV